jgi:hypothetical protein
MGKKRFFAVAVCAFAFMGVSASGALAGEVTGSGKDTAGPSNANSICVFSGLNDDPTAPLDGSGPNGPGGVAQSYGQDVKLGLIDPHDFNPGDACGPGSNPDRDK